MAFVVSGRRMQSLSLMMGGKANRDTICNYNFQVVDRIVSTACHFESFEDEQKLARHI